MFIMVSLLMPLPHVFPVIFSSQGLVLASTPSFSWDLVADVQMMLSYPFIRNAFLAGTIVAFVAGMVGYFVVLRSLSFAGYALSHSGFTGATGALWLGMSPLYGFLTFTTGSALLLGLLGRRLHGRDVVTGIVLSWLFGLGVLFLALYTGYQTDAYAVLFGQILDISQQDVQVTLITSIVSLLAMIAIYRPLLFASLDEELAEARGVPIRALSMLFLMILALTITVAVQVVGVLMIFTLLITPAAAAQRLTARPALAPYCSQVFWPSYSPGVDSPCHSTFPIP